VADNEVPIDITVDDTDAIKALKNLSKSAEDAVKALQTVGKGVSDSLNEATSKNNKTLQFLKDYKELILGVAAVAIGHELIDFLKDSANASAHFQGEVAKLEASLQSVGDFTPDVVADFKDFAKELQETSKFSEESAISQIAFAKQLGLSNDKAKELIQASADLATVTGKTLEESVHELGRTLTGTAGAIARTIPQLKGLSEEQLKAGAAIDFVSERLGGAAQKALNTYEGALIQLKFSQEDFRKSVGSIITENPKFIGAIQGLSGVFKDLEEFVLDNKDSIIDFVNNGINLFIALIPTALNGIGALVATFGELARAVGLIALDDAKFAKLNKAIDDTGLLIAKASLAAEDAGKKFEEISLKGAVAAKKQQDAEIVKGQSAVRASVDAANAEAERQKQTVKLLAEVDKFRESVFKKDLTDENNIAFERDKNLQKLKEFQDAGVIATKEAEDLRLVIVRESEQKIKDARKKKFDEFKKDVEDAAKNPIDFFIDVKSTDVSKISKELAKGVAGVLGGVADILKGKSGAEELTKKLSGALADAIIPGLGPVVSEITGVLQQGPEAVKKFVNEFVDSLPALVKNIAESIPVLVESLIRAAPKLIKSLVDAIPDIVHAFAAGAPEIAKALGEEAPVIMIELAKASPVLTQAITEEFVKSGGGTKWGIAIAQGMAQSTAHLITGNKIFEGFSKGADIFGQKISAGFFNLVGNIGSAWGSQFTNITTPSLNASSIQFGANISTVILAAIGGIPAVITAGFAAAIPQVVAGITAAFSGISGFITNAFNSILDPLANAIYSPVNRLIDFLNQFKFPSIQIPGIGDAGSAAGGVVSKIKSGLGLAEGGQVPSGFPNDTFPARLTSGENIISPGLSDKLSSFIDSAGGGSSNDVNTALLSQILSILQTPQQINTSITIGSRELAGVILDLQRNNQRLSA
jgi:hypothetical protein